jgi:ectoine hydroxylase-related dioxygenase (phytanoyl-CoA dioxygenase family)
MSIVRDGIQDDFRRDGAVCIRGAFSADEIALVERGIERNLGEPSERALVASRPDDPGRFFEDFCNWDRIPEFEEFVRTSPAATIAGELMGSRQVRLFHDHLLVNEPETKQKTPWHQGQPYYNVDGLPDPACAESGRGGRARCRTQAGWFC